MAGGQYPKQRILLVEDDPHVRNCFKLLLEFDGHQVQGVETGSAALALLEQMPFDLVITDYWMRPMKGDELARHIKERWPHQPVILATGSSAMTGTFESVIPGVDCLLNKPFSVRQLREAIIWVLKLEAQEPTPGQDIPALFGNDGKKHGLSRFPPVGDSES